MLDAPLIKISNSKEYPRPFVTIDVVLLTLRMGQLYVLLMRRGEEPFKNEWALPGGYIHIQEDSNIDDTALRILRDKAGIVPPYIEQLCGFGNALRDPRGWSITLAYFALVSSEKFELKAGKNAIDLEWRLIEDIKELSFDHIEIINTAVQRLRSKVEYSTLPVHLLPAKFTLPDLQLVYEQILGKSIDKSAFRKRIAKTDFIVPINGEKQEASNRPAQFYRLKEGYKTVFFNRNI